MEILFLTNTLGYGGAERTIVYLAEYLREHNDDVTILCLTDTVKYDVDAGIHLVKLGIPQNYSSISERAVHILQRFVRVNREIRRRKPDIVVCMISLSACYLSQWKRSYKLVVSERANPLEYGRKRGKKVVRIYKIADGIIFQTQAVSNLYPKIAKRKKVVIPNAVGNRYALNTVWQGKESKRIAAVGRLADAKDYPVMIRAFSIFRETHPHYELGIYGDGPLERGLKELAAELDLDGAVHFRGSRSDALKCVSKAACYVLSSKREGMPNTLLEAMAIGMPCISTDCAFGPRELIQNEHNGLLVPVGDEQALADGIARLVDDKAFAKMCGVHARNIADTNSVNTICAEYRKLF